MAEFNRPAGPFSTEQELEPGFMRGAARGAGIIGSSILPSWMTQLTPYRVDPEGEGHWQAPGFALAAYGGLGQLVPAAINKAFGSRIPAAPGSAEASRQYEETKEMALRTIPHVQPETPGEQALQDIAFGGAGMAVPLAGQINALMPGNKLKMLAHLINGPIDKTAPVAVTAGVGLSGAGGALVANEEEEQLRSMGLDPNEMRRRANTQAVPTPTQAVPPQTMPTPPLPPDLTQPDQGQTVAHPQQGAAANIPFPTISINRDELVPQFGEEGETDLSWGKIALGLSGTAVLGHGLLKYGGKTLVDPAWKAITGQWDQFNTAANRAAHNANLDAIDAGKSAYGASRGEAPLPGAAGRIGTDIAQSAWDSNRKMESLIQATTPKGYRSIGDQLAADLGTTNGSAALTTRISEQMATGVNKATGHVLPRTKDVIQTYDNLKPEQVKLWEEGIPAGHELDSRKIKAGNLAKANKVFTDEQTRHNFTSTPTEVLQKRYDDMMADPDTRQLAIAAHQIGQTNFAEGVAQGRYTQQQYADFQKNRPRFAPQMDLEGRADGSQVLDIGGLGWQTSPGRAIDALTQHYGKVYEGYANNTITLRMMDHLSMWQNGDPTRARIISKAPPRVGDTNNRAITVYRDGKPETYYINNTSVYRALTSNQARANMWMNSFDAIRRGMQSGTTGVSATVVAQRPFALISLLRNIPQIATDKAAGTRYGALDTGLQKLTGGLVGSRIGLDPTQYIGGFNEAIRGSGAVTARNMSDMLKNPSNPFTQGMRALKGDQWTDAFANRLRGMYENSSAAERRGDGLGGSGSGGIYDPRSFNVNPSNKSGYNPMADQVPGVFHPDGLQIPFTHVAIPGSKGVTSNYINLRTMLRDIHQEISDGANSYYWKQNAHLSPERRVHEARRVIGDPSVTGASAFAQRAGQSVPYLNPSVQDVVRTMRNLRDNPVAFVTGTVTTLGLIAAGSILTAMLAGPEAKKVLEREMTANERASNAVFFTDQSDARNHTWFSLPQRWRVLYPIFLEGIATGLGVWQAREGEPLHDRIVNSLADFFSQHISTGTRSAAVQGFGSFIDFVQVPQVVQAGAGVLNHRVNPIATTVMGNLVEGAPAFDRVITELGKETHIPGRHQSSIVSKDDNAWVGRFMNNLFGLAGTSMHEHLRQFTDRWAVNDDIGDAFSGVLPKAGQSWRDNAGFGTSVWGNNVKMNYRNPMAEGVEASLAKMREMAKKTDIQAQGFTRPGGLMVQQPEEMKVNPDPVIQQMMVVVNNNYNLIQKRMTPQINDLKRQLDDIKDDHTLSPRMKRSLENQQVGKINDLYEKVDMQINEMNGWLSHIVGKHVDVNSFDVSKGLEQFHD